jgi:hypothetical protein
VERLCELRFDVYVQLLYSVAESHSERGVSSRKAARRSAKRPISCEVKVVKGWVIVKEFFRASVTAKPVKVKCSCGLHGRRR